MESGGQLSELCWPCLREGFINRNKYKRQSVYIVKLRSRSKGDSKVDFRGDFKQDMKGDLLSSSGQVRSRSGLVQVWFSLQPKFNSFELDSEVGRLVGIKYNTHKKTK